MSDLLSERRIISVLILLFTVGLIISTFGLEFSDLGGAFSPMFFPRIILMVLMALAALNVVIDILAKNTSKPIKLLPVITIGGAFVGYVVLLPTLGYFICSVCVGMIILLALGLRNPVHIVMVPVFGAGALVGLFNHVLKMPLPNSPFFWWI